MIILNQQQQIDALTDEVNSLKCLVDSDVMGSKDNKKEEEIIEINNSGKHCDQENKHKLKITEKLFQCNMCDHTCEKEIAMIKHTNTKHQAADEEIVGKKKFFCHECDSLFTTKYSLKKHEAVHNDIMNLKCDMCAKEFGKLNQMKENIHNEHKISNNSPK